jgi:hypothetical protein
MPNPLIGKKIVEVFLENSGIMAWCSILLKDHSVKNTILKKLSFKKLLKHVKVNGSCDPSLCKERGGMMMMMMMMMVVVVIIIIMIMMIMMTTTTTIIIRPIHFLFHLSKPHIHFRQISFTFSELSFY